MIFFFIGKILKGVLLKNTLKINLKNLQKSKVKNEDENFQPLIYAIYESYIRRNLILADFKNVIYNFFTN